jgi:hypothetical protein
METQIKEKPVEKVRATGSQRIAPFLWQVVPSVLPKMMNDTDPKKSGRVMQAMLQMKKLDIAVLMQAFEGK